MLAKYLKLIRAKNLVIIIITQYLMRYAVIFPMLKKDGYVSQFSEINFMLLVLSTVLLAAAGYVINDYFDTKTDLLNRPQAVIVGKHIKRRVAMKLHVILNIIGIAIGLYISIQINLWKIVYIYIIITGLLWFYSTSFKRQFLTGNVIVAFLTALVPFMTILFEIPPLNAKYAVILISINANFFHIFYWILGFSVFAFITTLTREIIKDVEDYEGDNAFGRRTMPIVAGVKTTKIITSSIVFITLSTIIFLFLKFFFFTDKNLHEYQSIFIISIIYISLFLIIPNILLIFKIYKAKTKENWHFASNLSKLIMLAGIFYSLIIYFIY